MKFNTLAEYFQRLENTASRLEMTEILSRLLTEVSGSEIDKVLYLLQGRVTPLYKRLDFGLGEKMVIKAIISALQLEKKIFMSKYREIGDLGLVVEFFKKQSPSLHKKDYQISQIYDELVRLAQLSGEGSSDQKISILSHIIQTADPLSCKYVVRIPINILRLGFSDMTILDAISWMIKGDKSFRSRVEKAYHVRPDLGFIGKTVKKKGIVGLDNINPLVFTPIIMMKAERLSSAKAIIEKVKKGAIEPKYDGFRLQVHFRKQNNKEVKLYSRNLDDVTYMYPDIVYGVSQQIKADEIIFEGEAVGYDPKNGNILPFQETVQRKRKYDIESKSKEIPLKLFAFDALYSNGKNLLFEPFDKRRKILEQQITFSKRKISANIFLSPQEIMSSKEQINKAFDNAVKEGLEGIMTKKLDGIYQPGARGWNWIKYKRSYNTKIDDTIDCLVMGYDSGKGKRASFGIGAFLVGIYHKQKDVYLTIAKIGTGLSDIEWNRLKKECDKLKTQEKPKEYLVDKQMDVDVWIKPKLVVEIKADEITRSSVHTAGRTLKPTKSKSAMQIDMQGYALRFPRLERFRYDKNPTDSTTLKELEQVYKSQKKQ